MDDAEVFARLRDLGLGLPPPPQPIAAYLPCVVHGGLAWVAGQIPAIDGVITVTGLLGQDVSVQEGAAGARRAAVQVLSVLHEALGSFDRLERMAQVSVFVAAAPGFTEHPKVANGASELFAEVLGEAGRHARMAVGAASLPLGAAVEVAATAVVSG